MKIRIIGVGNTLFRDDGIGFYLAEAIRKCSLIGSQIFIESLESLDYSSLSLIEDMEMVIFIDAVNPESTDKPRILMLEGDTLREVFSTQEFMTIDPHDLSPLQLMYIAYSLKKFSGKAFFLMIPPLMLDIGFGLTRETVERAIESIVILQNLLEKLGVGLTIDKNCVTDYLDKKTIYEDKA